MKKLLLIGLLLVPAVASAATFSNLTGLIDFFTGLITGSLIPVFVGLAVVAFLWGMFNFIRNSDSDTERQKGQQFMLWAVVGLFVMISVWGLVGVLAGTFGINVGLPKFPTGGRAPAQDCSKPWTLLPGADCR